MKPGRSALALRPSSWEIAHLQQIAHLYLVCFGCVCVGEELFEKAASCAWPFEVSVCVWERGRPPPTLTLPLCLLLSSPSSFIGELCKDKPFVYFETPLFAHQTADSPFSWPIVSAASSAWLYPHSMWFKLTPHCSRSGARNKYIHNWC